MRMLDRIWSKSGLEPEKCALIYQMCCEGPETYKFKNEFKSKSKIKGGPIALNSVTLCKDTTIALCLTSLELHAALCIGLKLGKIP